MDWYCIHTKPKKEEHVELYCRNTLGLETYCPQLRKYRTVRRGRRLIVGPLFPRYIFCRFNPARSFRAVRYAPETLDVVNVGGRPAIVDNELIADLKQRAERASESGECTSGHLRGLTALHVRDDRDRVATLLSLLKESALLTISRDSAPPASSGPSVPEQSKSSSAQYAVKTA